MLAEKSIDWKLVQIKAQGDTNQLLHLNQEKQFQGFDSMASNLAPQNHPGATFGSIFQVTSLRSDSNKLKRAQHSSLDKNSFTDNHYFDIGKRVQHIARINEINFHKSLASEKSENLQPHFDASHSRILGEFCLQSNPQVPHRISIALDSIKWANVTSPSPLSKIPARTFKPTTTSIILSLSF